MYKDELPKEEIRREILQHQKYIDETVQILKTKINPCQCAYLLSRTASEVIFSAINAQTNEEYNDLYLKSWGMLMQGIEKGKTNSLTGNLCCSCLREKKKGETKDE